MRGISLLQLDRPETLNCQYIVASLDREAPAGLRDLLVDVLWAENLLARKYFHPGCHRAVPYAARTPAPVLPVTEDLCRRVLVLPTGTAVEPGHIQQAAECIRFILDHAGEIQHRHEHRN
jgi:dTDP-4-amino-4,6-dideoxygalactose transaminase